MKTRPRNDEFEYDCTAKEVLQRERNSAMPPRSARISHLLMWNDTIDL